MPPIELKYGRGLITVDYPKQRFQVLQAADQAPGLSDAELGERLDQPIDSRPVDEIVQPGESVLIVVPDATRRTASGQMVNLVVRRLIAAGTLPYDIRIIFATGIHRRVTDEERAAILTPFIFQRIKTLDHDPRDLMRIVRLGETSEGIPIELDRALIEHDHVILIGGVSFHYFAGFTGGRKLICPGLASSRTINETHKLAFDRLTLDRRAGVGPGRLDGNPVHEAFVEASSKVKSPFAINTIVNDDGAAIALYCGHWITSHRAACDAYARSNTVRISGPRGLVIVSCGGYPHDINMVQAHKAIDAAAAACTDGGTIVLLAECSEGMGRKDMLDWFDSENSAVLAGKLANKYQVNGQTAWSLLKKAEKFDVKILTDLDANVTRKMRLKKIEVSTLNRIVEEGEGLGYIMPHGARTAVALDRLL